MAGRGAPTFLKRQKEIQRAARAKEKRLAKQARRENRAVARLDPSNGEDVAPETQEQEQEPTPDDSPED